MSATSPEGPVLRLFSYLPNPRLAKATIAARLCGLDLETRGAKPPELANWLWDFEARPLAPGEADASDTERQARTGFQGKLHKTDAFLDAHPFGTVPAAFSPDGRVGIFESNSIARAVARIGQSRCNLYGHDAYEASRIDSFLDVSLVFARASQPYLLALGGDRLDAVLYEETREALTSYLAGMDQALAPDRATLVGEALSLADIVYAAEITLLCGEGRSLATLASLGVPPLLDAAAKDFPRAWACFERLCAHAAFAPDLGPYLDKVARKRAEAEAAQA